MKPKSRTGMRAGIALMVLILALSSFSLSHAAVIFSDDFESGGIANWNDSTGNPVASQDVAKAGSWSLKLTYPTDNSDDHVTKTGLSNTHIFFTSVRTI